MESVTAGASVDQSRPDDGFSPALVVSGSSTGGPAPGAVAPRIAPSARIGVRTTVWDLSQIREDVSIGTDCVIGRNVYVDHGVEIGNRCKIQNNALIYWPATIGDGVFVGPGAVLTNDRYPRAILPDGSLKAFRADEAVGVTVAEGASIGAGVIVVAGVHIGPWSMVGAGSVVTRDVPPHALVAGNPCVQIGWVGKTGRRLIDLGDGLGDPDSSDRYIEVDGRLVVVQ